MGVEIERKFLVKRDLWKLVIKENGQSLHQGYLCADDKKTVRVRTIDKKGFLTIKGPTQGISRSEFEYEIPFDEAVELLKTLADSTLEKIRYKINFMEKVWEIDEFKGENDGLIIAEIELVTPNENFILPDWIDKEVSDDKRYFNSYLSKHPFNFWKNNL